MEHANSISAITFIGLPLEQIDSIIRGHELTPRFVSPEGAEESVICLSFEDTDVLISALKARTSYHKLAERHYKQRLANSPSSLRVWGGRRSSEKISGLVARQLEHEDKANESQSLVGVLESALTQIQSDSESA